MRRQGDHQAQQLADANSDIRKLLEGDCSAAKRVLQALDKIKLQLEGRIREAEMHTIAQTKASETTIVQQTKSTEVAIMTKFDSLTLAERERCVQNLLDSLSFETMYDRENSIRARVIDYGQTAKWIFEEVVGRTEQDEIKQNIQSRFERWLREGDGH